MRFGHSLSTKASNNRSSWCVQALEPSPHADVARTIISCADLSIVKRKCDYNFIADHLFYFIIQYDNLNS